MPEWVIIAVTLLVMAGVTSVLIGSLVRNVLAERRTNNVRRIWANFGLSIAFCCLFLVSWIAQAIVEWDVYRDEQLTHGGEATLGGFVTTFGQSTLENWQSEFLQLFSFVVLAALLVHRNSAESKDSEERIEKKLDRLAERLEEIESVRTAR